MREGTAGIEGQRREHGEDDGVEVLVGGLPRLVVEPVVVDDVDAGVGELGQQIGVDLPSLPHELEGSLTGLRQGLGRRPAVAGALGHAGAHLLLETGDADHEELAQVGAHDAEELQTLEERVAPVARLVEDARLELEEAQLPVEEERRVAQVGAGSFAGSSPSALAASALETVCVSARGVVGGGRRGRRLGAGGRLFTYLRLRSVRAFHVASLGDGDQWYTCSRRVPTEAGGDAHRRCRRGRRAAARRVPSA